MPLRVVVQKNYQVSVSLPQAEETKAKKVKIGELLQRSYQITLTRFGWHPQAQPIYRCKQMMYRAKIIRTIMYFNPPLSLALHLSSPTARDIIDIQCICKFTISPTIRSISVLLCTLRLSLSIWPVLHLHSPTSYLIYFCESVCSSSLSPIDFDSLQTQIFPYLIFWRATFVLHLSDIFPHLSPHSFVDFLFVDFVHMFSHLLSWR